jgi:hypothetical protein
MAGRFLAAAEAVALADPGVLGVAAEGLAKVLRCGDDRASGVTDHHRRLLLVIVSRGTAGTAPLTRRRAWVTKIGEGA